MDKVRFQLDEHIPHAVAQSLRRRGVDVLTAAEAGVLGAPDAEILERSRAAGRVLVTNDSDFLRLHNQRCQHAGITYCQQGARTIGELVTSLVMMFEVLEPIEMVDRVEFL